MSSWEFIYEGFVPEQEGLREALCTLGNGYFATRGAGPEAEAGESHYPGTYLAGGYNRMVTHISGRDVENEDLVNMPNWLPLTFRLEGGRWFNIRAVTVLEFRQVLELKEGILRRTIRFRDKQDRETVFEFRRFVHMGDHHLAGQEVVITPVNWSGSVELRSALDGQVINAGVDRYKELNGDHLECIDADDSDPETITLTVRTKQSLLLVAQAALTRVFAGREQLKAERKIIEKPGYIAHQMVAHCSPENPLRLEKIVAMYSSRDDGISEPTLEARKGVADAGSFEELLARHKLVWEHLWRRFDVKFDGNSNHGKHDTGQIVHLHIFHLLQTTSMHTMDLDVGVPARGWHGEAYRGHIFWDELFIFPFLNLRVPEITRSLLKYRYRRLNEAISAAAREGYGGAMYPWQSGSNGREESQRVHLNPRSGRWIPDYSWLQRHVNSAIAYNIWQYYQVTNDIEFLELYGSRMILEIARFWASKASYNEKLDRYEILGVMGPDEYHDAYPDRDEPGLDNNAYTNVMAVWVLSKALELFGIMDQPYCREVSERMGLSEEEKRRWEEISRKMRIVFHGDGIISQFEHYDTLEEFDWEGYREKYGDIHRLDRILEAEGDSVNRYQASKQADVLMLFYLFSSEELSGLFKRLGYPFAFETIPKNIDYYLKRTSHGSTLSRVVHSWVLARSQRKQSWSLFEQALQADVADVQGGTTPEGIHLGAMAGTVDMLTRGYTGVEPRGQVLWFNPAVPEGADHLHMHLRYRGNALEVDITPGELKVRTLPCHAEPIRIGYRGKTYEMKTDEYRSIPLKAPSMQEEAEAYESSIA
jgi:alpha,alpha-trehalase